jgi:penicillin-binding protein 2
MVSRPAFDPNVFARNVTSSGNRAEVRSIINDPATPLFNKAIRGTYPTGSTWKILIAASALEENLIDAGSRIACGGGLQVGNKFVACMGSHGAPDIHTALVYSCDGFFYRLGLKMGVDRIHEWVVRFGMGQKTGVDLPHEERGIIPDRAWKKRQRDPVWRDFDTVMASVGQGSVAVTPIQLLRAESGIMMSGQFFTPHLFKEAKQTDIAALREYQGKVETMGLATSTVQIIDYGAWGVVNAGGTGAAAAIPSLNIGGKTGTAQVIAKEKVRLKEHQDHSWFIAFAPVHLERPPEVAIVVLTEHGGQGGRASAPKARAIFASYFSKKLGRPVLPDLVAGNTLPGERIAKPGRQ